ncbi:Mobile element protein [Acidisarcina polymorpha]|uniref:Mobile element protein n=1 Tax=Acidisarcina polymorpha TaxID=2211140 RepID=A0A2Z5G9J2_9BACT|nr:IS66 family transposase zinc-finger binding domain-containing protein [Acidisarcina polymorpha]AXC15811.1 Mobile element protein [Acidisarcina polymorpha]
MQLLDLEPGASSDDVQSEIERGPLPDATANNDTTDKQRRGRQNHPGRNELPAHLKRVDRMIPCASEQCKCGRCGGDTRVIGYDITEVLDMKPVEFFVTRIMREKRACVRCIKQGVATAPVPVRIAPRSIFSDETIISFLVGSMPTASRCIVNARSCCAISAPMWR